MNFDLKRTSKVRRKFLSLLLTAAMVLALMPAAVPVSAASEGDVTTDDYEFIAATGTLTIKTDAGTAYDEEEGILSTNWKYDGEDEGSDPDSGIVLSAVLAVIVGEGVMALGDQAFTFCSNITAISLPSTLTAIGDYAISTTYNSGLTAIEVAEGNPVFASADGVLYGRSGGNITSVTFCPPAKSGAIEILESVTEIGESAFYRSGITSVEIPSGVETIGDYAFEECTSLMSVTIPASVETIGYNGFYNCTGLETVYFEGAVAPALGGEVFYYYNGTGDIPLEITIYYPGGAEGYDAAVFSPFGLRAVWSAGAAEELEELLDNDSEEDFNDGDIIRLTDDIIYTKFIEIDGKTVTFDTGAGANAHNLNITATGEGGLAVYSGNIHLAGDGELNVTVTSTELTNAVYVENGSAQISRVTAEGSDIYAVQAYDGGTVTVAGCITVDGDGSSAVYADDGEVTVTGDVTMEGDYSFAVRSENGGTVTVTGGVTAAGEEACAVNAGGGTIEITGAVTATGEDATAVFAASDGRVTVNGAVLAPVAIVIMDGDGNETPFSLGQGALSETAGYTE